MLQFNAEGTVVSLTGSNPLHVAAMESIRRQGDVVFLDVQSSDILQRLESMKVDRIVGQLNGASMRDILNRRQPFYESCYDARVICEAGELLESVSVKVVAAVRRLRAVTGDKFVSTRGRLSEFGFGQALLRGLADDGGLFVPADRLPRFKPGELFRLVPLDYGERAIRILEQLIHPSDVHPSDIRRFVQEAYRSGAFEGDDVTGIVPLDGERFEYVHELFRGLTASFKDLALQLLPHFFQHAATGDGSW